MGLALNDISVIIGNCGPGEQITLTLASPVTLSAEPAVVAVNGKDTPAIKIKKHTGSGAQGLLSASPGVGLVVFDGDCCIPQDNGTRWTFDRNIEAAVAGNVLILSLIPETAS